MENDIKVIRKRCGLLVSELAALIGSCHTSQLKVEARNDHRPMTTSLYWLLQHDAVGVIRVLLDRWLYEKPKNQEQMRLLTQIAHRYKGSDLGYWLRTVRTVHPEFFN